MYEKYFNLNAEFKIYFFEYSYYKHIVLLLNTRRFQNLLEKPVIYLSGLISSLSRLTSPFGRGCLRHN